MSWIPTVLGMAPLLYDVTKKLIGGKRVGKDAFLKIAKTATKTKSRKGLAKKLDQYRSQKLIGGMQIVPLSTKEAIYEKYFSGQDYASVVTNATGADILAKVDMLEKEKKMKAKYGLTPEDLANKDFSKVDGYLENKTIEDSKKIADEKKHRKFLDRYIANALDYIEKIEDNTKSSALNLLIENYGQEMVEYVKGLVESGTIKNLMSSEKSSFKKFAENEDLKADLDITGDEYFHEIGDSNSNNNEDSGVTAEVIADTSFAESVSDKIALEFKPSRLENVITAQNKVKRVIYDLASDALSSAGKVVLYNGIKRAEMTQTMATGLQKLKEFYGADERIKRIFSDKVDYDKLTLDDIATLAEHRSNMAKSVNDRITERGRELNSLKGAIPLKRSNSPTIPNHLRSTANSRSKRV